MSKPVSPKPLRKVAAICAYSQDDPSVGAIPRGPKLERDLVEAAALTDERLQVGLAEMIVRNIGHRGRCGHSNSVQKSRPAVLSGNHEQVVRNEKPRRGGLVERPGFILCSGHHDSGGS